MSQASLRNQAVDGRTDRSSSRSTRPKNPCGFEAVPTIGFGQFVEGFQQMTDAGCLGLAAKTGENLDKHDSRDLDGLPVGDQFSQ